MTSYEAIFSGQTSPTQKLARKAAWITSLSLKETEIEEPDKLAKFSAACVRLSTAADELDLFITDDLNRLNYEVLQNEPEAALALAKESGRQWQHKKQKDLQGMSNLKNTFSWNAIFDGVNKDALIEIIEQHYKSNITFRLAVDNAVSLRIAYITELALKDELTPPTSSDEMLRKFRTYVIEECAGVLALRQKGYSDAFYLAKLNQATAMIATTQFILKPDATAEQNDILTKINETPLTFHTPSQYKPITKSPPLPVPRTNGREKTSTPQYQLHRNGNGSGQPRDDREALYRAFFDSKTIDLETKVRVLKEHAGFGAATDDNAANRDHFDDSHTNGHYEDAAQLSTLGSSSGPKPPAEKSPGLAYDA